MCCRQVVSGSHSPAEAYEAVPQLHERGKSVVQNIRKRAREARAKQEAAPAPAPAAEKQVKPVKRKAKVALLPQGKRLRSDQVEALAAVKIAKRQRRAQAHKQATVELEKWNAPLGSLWMLSCLHAWLQGLVLS